MVRGEALGTYGGPLTFNSGSTLAADGTESAGRLIVNGNLTMASGSAFDVTLNGNTVTTGFDRVGVTGSVNLGGATLTGNTDGFNPGAGDRYFILLNDGTDAITGTFAGLGQDATGTLGIWNFQISYEGDSLTNNLTGGNDVVFYNFTPVPEPGAMLAVAAVGCGLVAGCRRVWRRVPTAG